MVFDLLNLVFTDQQNVTDGVANPVQQKSMGILFSRCRLNLTTPHHQTRHPAPQSDSPTSDLNVASSSQSTIYYFVVSTCIWRRQNILCMAVRLVGGLLKFVTHDFPKPFGKGIIWVHYFPATAHVVILNGLWMKRFGGVANPVQQFRGSFRLTI